MTASEYSSTSYRAIPSSEDQARHAAVHEVGGDGFHSTNEEVPAKTQTRWMYFLLGCAILLPWTSMVNGTLFFLSRLADSPFYPTFTSWWSSVYMLTKLVCQFYCTITSKQSSPSRRIFASIIASLLLVISLCLSTFIRGTPSTFFVFTLFSSACLAITAGYLCTAVYAGAAVLGTSFLQTVFLGHAAIALAASVVQLASSVISLWGLSSKSVSVEVVGADGQAEELAARIFFAVAAVFLGITLVAYTRLTRQSFYKSVTDVLEQHFESGGVDELTGLVTPDCSNESTATNSRLYQVFKKNIIFMFSIAYVLTITLALIPAITSRVQSVNPKIHPLLFTSVHFLVFNIGDLVGRYISRFSCLAFGSIEKILAMSLLRTLFIPLILLCNIHRPAATLPVSPIINSDILFMFIILMMGFTNGFVLTLAMLVVSSLEYNPRLEGRREDVDVAATLGGSSGIVGLACGAFSSFGVQAMI